MPRKNVRKTYADNSYYHVYNRSVDRRDIFSSKADINLFHQLLAEYLSPPQKPPLRSTKIRNRLIELPQPPRKNFHQHITLLCYCLMPNHFHLLLHQQDRTDIARFMKSLSVRYAMLYNRHHRRQGQLFESRYKAVLVKTDAQLLHLSRYIHLNPHTKPGDNPLKKGLSLVKNVSHTLTSHPSSYRDYLSQKPRPWINPSIILGHFSTTNRNLTYRHFVETDTGTDPLPDHLTLDTTPNS